MVQQNTVTPSKTPPTSSLSDNPWGPVQNQVTIAPGITKLQCATHGGYHLSADRLATFTTHFPHYKTGYATLPWFEEDIDWMLLPLAFKDCFNLKTLFYAFTQTYQTTDPWLASLTQDFYQSPEGQHIRTICEGYRNSFPDEWHLTIQTFNKTQTLLTFTHHYTHEMIRHSTTKPVDLEALAHPYTLSQIQSLNTLLL
jgi:hypothetical protein